MIGPGVRIVLIVLVYVAWHSTLLADAVTIRGEASDENLTIKVEKASIHETLLAMRKTFGFEVKLPTQSSPDVVFSAIFTGKLETILKRLLRNRNHMIIFRSEENVSEISRIVILDSKLGSTPSTVLIPKATATSHVKEYAIHRQADAARRLAALLRRQADAARRLVVLLRRRADVLNRRAAKSSTRLAKATQRRADVLRHRADTLSNRESASVVSRPNQ